MSPLITIKPAIASLQGRRLELRRLLAEQREIIAFQLAPNHRLRQPVGLAYPRSMTMRLLTQNPAPALKLIIGVATWLLGARVARAVHDGMQFLKMLRTGATLH
jgi:hypothetical protein